MGAAREQSIADHAVAALGFESSVEADSREPRLGAADAVAGWAATGWGLESIQVLFRRRPAAASLQVPIRRLTPTRLRAGQSQVVRTGSRAKAAWREGLARVTQKYLDELAKTFPGAHAAYRKVVELAGK